MRSCQALGESAQHCYPHENVLTGISAKWCAVVAAFLLSVPLLSATAVGEGVVTQTSGRVVAVKPAKVTYLTPKATAVPTPRAVAVLPAPARVPVPATTPEPTPPTPQPTIQPPPGSAPGYCADAVSINVVDAELTGVVQAGIDLLTAHFGCQKFRIEGGGLPVKFGEITPLLNGKVLGYAYSAPAAYEIWLNRDCWGVIDGWDGVVAHELGHYLGWQHGDDHPYMWLPPPPGSYARPGDSAIVCG